MLGTYLRILSSPLPSKVPLLLFTFGDCNAIYLLSQVHVHPGTRSNRFFLVVCINSRILLFCVRHSHPIVEILRRLLLTVLASHIARPTHLANIDLSLKIHFIRLSPTTFFRNRMSKWVSPERALKPSFL